MSTGKIQGFISDFEGANSGRAATNRVRDKFSAKLEEVRQQKNQLKILENDLVEAIDYLESCQTCTTTHHPDDCRACDHHGHELGEAPELFYPLAQGVHANQELSPNVVKLSALRRDPNEGK